MNGNELIISKERQLGNLNNNFFERQKNFLESDLGKVINNGVDLGLRIILPDIIEDEIIDIKNEIINNGFNEGIKSAIDKVIDFGKSVLRNFYW